MTFYDVFVKTTEPDVVCQWIAENLSEADVSVSGWEDTGETILMRLRLTDERAAVLTKTFWGTGSAGL